MPNPVHISKVVLAALPVDLGRERIPKLPREGRAYISIDVAEHPCNIYLL
jgi:hypothetical protein